MVRELKASRSRILAAADSERQRIERDLHDGAQQRLVALCIHLELAAERTADPVEADALRGLADEVEQALDEIRSLTHGIYPRRCSSRGSGRPSAPPRCGRRCRPASRSRGSGPIRARSPLPSILLVEALQKCRQTRPRRALRAVVLRETDSELCFSVSDDGPGFRHDSARVGAGMVNMRDRITSVGGKLTVDSRPGRGPA